MWTLSQTLTPLNDKIAKLILKEHVEVGSVLENAIVLIIFPVAAYLTLADRQAAHLHPRHLSVGIYEALPSLDTPRLQGAPAQLRKFVLVRYVFCAAH